MRFTPCSAAARACVPAACSMSSAPQLAFAHLAKSTFYKQRNNQMFPRCAKLRVLLYPGQLYCR